MSEQNGSALAGQRILVTRTREQASVLSEQFHALGAIPIEFPTIRIVPPHDWTALDAALTRLYTAEPYAYDWLILTSANGVHICMQRLRTLGYDPAALRDVRIATIGPATAAALKQYGVVTDLIPDEYIAEGVTKALFADAHERHQSLQSQHILLARAAEARKILVTELEGAGAYVDEVPAYTTVTVDRDDEQGRQILQRLQQRQLDLLTFTSSSTVRNFVLWLRSCASDSDTAESLIEMVRQNVQLASIGPITSQTARELGLKVAIEAQEFTIDGLVQAIVEKMSM